jgi:hypothetical protein
VVAAMSMMGAVDIAINHMIGESTKYPVTSNVEYEIEALNVVFIDTYFSAVVIGKYLKREDNSKQGEL